MYAGSFSASSELAATGASAVASALGATFSLPAALGLRAGAIWLSGVAIKLVDAVVDEEPSTDAPVACSHAAVALALASVLDGLLAGALAGAAWAIGMLKRPRSGGGSAGAALVGLALLVIAGAPRTLFALAAMGAVQVIDWWVDGEEWGGAGAVPRRMTLAAGVALYAFATALDPLDGALVFLLVGPSTLTAERAALSGPVHVRWS